MKKRGLILLVGLVWLFNSAPLSAQAVTLIQDNGDSTKRVDIVVVGDGYTQAELGKFATDTASFFDGFFAEQPFKEYRKYFNLRRIDVASAESGADHSDRTPQVFKNTAFDAAYNCSGIQRLVCVNTTKVLNATGVLPPSQRDLTIVLVNDPEYGGSGGSVAVASTHASAVELILHETGHTFALLADEYTSQPPACSDSNEPSQANATKEVNRTLIKWRAWIDSSTAVPTTATTLGIPGLYLGSNYCPTTEYRPTYDSKMRSLGRPYEQINAEQFVKRFYAYATPIESRAPSATTTIALKQGQTQAFTITSPQPATHTITVTWTVNGQDAGTGATYTLSTQTLAVGSYTVTATALDSTTMVRTDTLNVLRQQTSWTVSLAAGTITPTTTYALPSGGGYSGVTSGSAGTSGHASMQPAGSQTGLAIFSLRQNNVLISEAAVPASPRIIAGRIYAEINGPVNTGIAISNPNATSVTIICYFTEALGTNLPPKAFSIDAHSQIAKFLDDPLFGLPSASSSFQGTFTFSALAPVAAIALRSLTNERSDFLMTTLPVVDLTGTPLFTATLFPHFAAGGGWTTQILLVNPADAALTGSLSFRSPTNGAATLVQVEGSAASSFAYVVPPNSSKRISVTSDQPVSGSVLLTPTAGQRTPAGLLVFSYREARATITEAGVPTVAAGSSFVMYAEASGVFGRAGSVQTGVALANASANPTTVTLELTDLQGKLAAQTSITLQGNAQQSTFINQIPELAGITLPFQGRLRVSSTGSNITVVGLRGRYNERLEFLISTTPPFAENQPPETELIFPHFVDGGGYTTQFVILNGQAQTSGGTLVFYTQSGQAIALVLK